MDFLKRSILSSGLNEQEAGGKPRGWLVEGQAAEGLWGWKSERR